jgi:hypothetical protein
MVYINNDYAHKMNKWNVTLDAKVFISVLLTHEKNGLHLMNNNRKASPSNNVFLLKVIIIPFLMD